MDFIQQMAAQLGITPAEALAALAAERRAEAEIVVRICLTIFALLGASVLCLIVSANRNPDSDATATFGVGSLVLAGASLVAIAVMSDNWGAAHAPDAALIRDALADTMKQAVAAVVDRP